MIVLITINLVIVDCIICYAPIVVDLHQLYNVLLVEQCKISSVYYLQIIGVHKNWVVNWYSVCFIHFYCFISLFYSSWDCFMIRVWIYWALYRYFHRCDVQDTYFFFIAYNNSFGESISIQRYYSSLSNACCIFLYTIIHRFWKSKSIVW